MKPGQKVLLGASLLLNIALGVLCWVFWNKQNIPAVESNPKVRMQFDASKFDFSDTPLRDEAWKLEPPEKKDLEPPPDKPPTAPPPPSF